MIHIITGPPAAGKSTYLKQHAKPGDLRIDFDELANLLTGTDPGNNEHDRDIRDYVRAVRKTAIDKALAQTTRDVWIIHSTPGDAAMRRYHDAGAKIHVIDPGKDVVMKRCKEQRPPLMLKIAAQWYDQQQRGRQPQTQTQKGLGHRHQQQRKRLLYNLTDGTPCWWCGKPMYREKQRNWDKLPLAADHTNARALHGVDGNLADRLLHGSCNSQRGDGTRDHTRPALNNTGVRVVKPQATGPGKAFVWPT